MTQNALSPRRRPGRGLALVGYRGTGKSTVGTILAGRLSRTFLDADIEIERRTGRSIAAIFSDWGESAFRDREEQTLAELIDQFPTAILATGGGAVLRETNRRRLRDFGFVVWLRADPAELARRLEGDPSSAAGRPALTPAGTISEIAQVLKERMAIYQGLADTAIETGGRSPDQVAAAILDCWNPEA
jgi:shikimate kinase